MWTVSSSGNRFLGRKLTFFRFSIILRFVSTLSGLHRQLGLVLRNPPRRVASAARKSSAAVDHQACQS